MGVTRDTSFEMTARDEETFKRLPRNEKLSIVGKAERLQQEVDETLGRLAEVLGTVRWLKVVGKSVAVTAGTISLLTALAVPYLSCVELGGGLVAVSGDLWEVYQVYQRRDVLKMTISQLQKECEQAGVLDDFMKGLAAADLTSLFGQFGDVASYLSGPLKFLHSMFSEEDSKVKAVSVVGLLLSAYNTKGEIEKLWYGTPTDKMKNFKLASLMLEKLIRNLRALIDE